MKWEEMVVVGGTIFFIGISCTCNLLINILVAVLYDLTETSGVIKASGFSSSPDSSRSTSRRSSSRTSPSALLANLQKENVRVLSKLSSSMPTHLHKCTCTHSCTHARTHAPTHSHTHPHQHTHHLFIAIHESAAIQRNPADSMDLF